MQSDFCGINLNYFFSVEIRIIIARGGRRTLLLMCCQHILCTRAAPVILCASAQCHIITNVYIFFQRIYANHEVLNQSRNVAHFRHKNIFRHIWHTDSELFDNYCKHIYTQGAWNYINLPHLTTFLHLKPSSSLLKQSYILLLSTNKNYKNLL